MDQRTKPAARLQPLPPEHSPELREQFESMRKNLGLVPRWRKVGKHRLRTLLPRTKFKFLCSPAGSGFIVNRPYLLI